jgi:hypothetical protein
MIIIGCDYHPGFQQIAYVDSETGDPSERAFCSRQNGLEELKQPRPLQPKCEIAWFSSMRNPISLGTRHAADQHRFVDRPRLLRSTVSGHIVVAIQAGILLYCCQARLIDRVS